MLKYKCPECGTLSEFQLTDDTIDGPSWCPNCAELFDLDDVRRVWERLRDDIDPGSYNLDGSPRWNT